MSRWSVHAKHVEWRPNAGVGQAGTTTDGLEADIGWPVVDPSEQVWFVWPAGRSVAATQFTREDSSRRQERNRPEIARENCT